MIADSFNLTPEETEWVIYQTSVILKPFENYETKSLPSYVTQELSTGYHSKSLEGRKDGSYLSTSDNELTTASHKGWVDTIYDMVIDTYELTAFQQVEVKARFSSLLNELGIGEKTNPRAALYLPSAVRWKTARRVNVSPI